METKLTRCPVWAKILPFALAVVLSSVWCSCAQGQPVIRSTSVQLLRVQGPAGLFAERLSLFVFYEDSDGPADYGHISLTHDDTGYVWNIPSEDTMVRMRGKDRWIGSNSLAGPGDEPFPEGSYTIAVADLVGNEATSAFILKRPKFPQTAPVKFSIEEEKWILTRNPEAGDFTHTWFFLLDDQARLLYSWKVPEDDGTVANGPVANFTVLAAGTASVQCFTENSDATAGVLLTPIDIR
jgi:hypothetical protein